MILYDYQETREAKHPKAFLEGFKGYLHTDRYFGYHNLSPDIRVVGCQAHAKRNFTDAVDAIRNEEKRSASPAMIGIAYFDKLSEIERNIAVLSPEKRKLKRQELSLPVLYELRTAKENGLDTYRYLTWVLKKPRISICLIHLMLIPFFLLTLRQIVVLRMFLYSVRYLTLTFPGETKFYNEAIKISDLQQT